MNEMILKKYHGLGNDYLVLDPHKNHFTLQTRNIEMLCRRNFGVGADGVLYGPLWEEEKIKVRIFNPDGSEAECSGNGILIFAKYLLDQGYVSDKKITLETVSGKVFVEFLQEDARMMRVNMGKPAYAGKQLPMSGLEGEVVNAHLRFQDNLYNATCLSVGTPNCVIMQEEVTSQKAKSLGPYVEQAAYFPNRINMQLCKVQDRANIIIEIYERGAGYTLASGTGASRSCCKTHGPGGRQGDSAYAGRKPAGRARARRRYLYDWNRGRGRNLYRGREFFCMICLI